jgi:hypothetical protein
MLAGDAEAFHGAEADADENEIEVALKIGERDGIAHFGLAEFYAHVADHFHFAEGVGGAELVFGDAVGVEAAGERAVVEDDGLRALAGEFGCAG